MGYGVDIASALLLTKPNLKTGIDWLMCSKLAGQRLGKRKKKGAGRYVGKGLRFSVQEGSGGFRMESYAVEVCSACSGIAESRSQCCPNAVLLRRNVKRFQGGIVPKAHRLLYHSTLGLRVIKKIKRRDRRWIRTGPPRDDANAKRLRPMGFDRYVGKGLEFRRVQEGKLQGLEIQVNI